MPDAHKSQKMSDLLKLELQVAVSDHVGSGNQTRITAYALNTGAIS